jgi:hypothetical protein
MCSVELNPRHAHLVEPASRKLSCACQACAILFSNSAGQKYKRVPERVVWLPNFQISDAQWESLMIPINMAFFYRSSFAERIVVFYPSPAGATESLLDLDSWEQIVASNPILNEMEVDTEALLVNRVQRADYFIVPIDDCYRLVGLIRSKWKGLSGGGEVWEEINAFYEELKTRAVGSSEAAGA